MGHPANLTNLGSFSAMLRLRRLLQRPTFVLSRKGAASAVARAAVPTIPGAVRKAACTQQTEAERLAAFALSSSNSPYAAASGLAMRFTWLFLLRRETSRDVSDALQGIALARRGDDAAVLEHFRAVLSSNASLCAESHGALASLALSSCLRLLRSPGIGVDDRQRLETFLSSVMAQLAARPPPLSLAHWTGSAYHTLLQHYSDEGDVEGICRVWDDITTAHSQSSEEPLPPSLFTAAIVALCRCGQPAQSSGSGFGSGSGDPPLLHAARSLLEPSHAPAAEGSPHLPKALALLETMVDAYTKFEAARSSQSKGRHKTVPPPGFAYYLDPANALPPLDAILPPQPHPHIRQPPAHTDPDGPLLSALLQGPGPLPLPSLWATELQNAHAALMLHGCRPEKDRKLAATLYERLKKLDLPLQPPVFRVAIQALRPPPLFTTLPSSSSSSSSSSAPLHLAVAAQPPSLAPLVGSGGGAAWEALGLGSGRSGAPGGLAAIPTAAELRAALSSRDASKASPSVSSAEREEAPVPMLHGAALLKRLTTWKLPPSWTEVALNVFQDMRKLGVAVEPGVVRELVHTLSDSGRDLELLFSLRKRARSDPDDFNIPARQRDMWLRQARRDFARCVRLCLRLLEEGQPLLPSAVHLLLRYCAKHHKPYFASSLLSVLHHRQYPLDSRCMGAYFAAGSQLRVAKEVAAYAQLGLQVMHTQALQHTAETYEGLFRLYHGSGDPALLAPILQEMQQRGHTALLNGRMIRLLVAGLKRTSSWPAANETMNMLTRLSLLSSHKSVLSDAEAKEMLLTPEQARRVLKADPHLVSDVASSVLVTLQFLSPAPTAHALELYPHLAAALASASSSTPSSSGLYQQQQLLSGYAALLSVLLQGLAEAEAEAADASLSREKEKERQRLVGAILQAVDDIRTFEHKQRQSAEGADAEAASPRRQGPAPLLLLRVPGAGRSTAAAWKLSLFAVRSRIPEGLRHRLAALLASSAPTPSSASPDGADASVAAAVASSSSGEGTATGNKQGKRSRRKQREQQGQGDAS